jgi:hypothetical protein
MARQAMALDLPLPTDYPMQHRFPALEIISTFIFVENVTSVE